MDVVYEPGTPIAGHEAEDELGGAEVGGERDEGLQGRDIPEF